MAKRKKNANVDPDAPPVPQWTPPTEDVEWQDWMKSGIWASEDLCAYGKALKNPFKLPVPFFSAPDRARLSKSAAKALDDVIAIFEQRLAQSHDAPKISDLLKETKKKEYLANTKSEEYRIFLTWELTDSRRPQGPRKDFYPIHELIDPTKFELLIDWHMPEAAFKAFRAHVSRYPGCDAKNIVLTDEEKKQRGDTSKNKSTVTHVVVSAEAVEAFREGRENQLSVDAQTAIRLYNERCETFGMPKGFGHPNGFSRIDATMPGLWKGPRPNWRKNEDEKKTGNPDFPFTDAEWDERQQERQAQFMRAYMDGEFGSDGGGYDYGEDGDY